MSALRDDQVRRYSRHVLLPELGGVGQKRLLAGAVALPGLDLAGQAAALYLAAAGVGRLVVGDVGPVVAPGPLFEAEDVGRPGKDAARARIAALNADCRVVDAADSAVPLPLADAGSDPVAALGAGARAARQVIRSIVGDVS